MARKEEYLTKVDQYIGAKIHNLRVAHGYSRKELAKLIHVSNQQLHKYETGVNRICMGRLLMITRALSEHISFFYDGLLDKDSDGIGIEQHSTHRMCIEVARNFMKIGSDKQRKAVSALVKSLIEEEVKVQTDH